ncbi:MAG TPA: hypothetical protein VGG08_00550 [Solirubrobacteraceae bacterium]|jgi:hypothetical protein
MKHYRPLRLALVTLMALGSAFVTASASAELALPQLLAQKANERFTAKNTGAVRLEDEKGNMIECEGIKGEGTQETDTLGKFHIQIEKCKSPLLGECKTVADKKTGIILSEGTFHYVLDILGEPEESVAVLFEPVETVFECTLFAKNTLKGKLLCLILKPLVPSTTHEFHCVPKAGGGKGEQGDLFYWNDAGEKLGPVHLEFALNGSAFVRASLAWLSTIVFPIPVKFEND